MATHPTWLTYRTLVYQLTRREFKARYSSAKLGVAWAVLNPLLLMAILSVVFSRFVRIATGATPYPVFVLTGLVAWQFFRSSVGTATSCVVDDRDLYRRINFPRSFVPLSIVLANLLNLILTLPILLGFMLVFGCAWHPSMLLAPLALVVLWVLAYGVSLVTSVATVYYRDVKYMIEPLLLVLFYLSPIFYPLELVPEAYRSIYVANPLVGVMVFFREALLGGTVDSWGLLGMAAAVSAAFLLLGYLLYRRYSGCFADLL